MSYQDRLASCKAQLEKVSKDYINSLELEDEDFDDSLESSRTNYVKGVQDLLEVVEEAQQSNAVDLEDIVKQAEVMVNQAVGFAYSRPTGEDGEELFTSMRSFGHSSARPLAKQERKKGEFSHRMVKVAAMLLERMKGSGLFIPNKGAKVPKPTAPGPWKDVVRLHPLSTRCARFHEDIPETTPPADKPSALSVFQARAEVSSGDIYLPTGLHVSASGRGILVPGQGGFKQRAPYVALYDPAQQPSDGVWNGMLELTGLANIAYDGAIDDESGLLFVGDNARIKSYSWWDTTKNARRKRLVPTHTMNSAGFGGNIAVLPNGRLVRAGTGAAGKIGVWNLGDLPVHDSARKGKDGYIGGGSIRNEYGEIDSWRDDPEGIELSVGSNPTSTITMADEDKFQIRLWNRHPSVSGSMLAASDTRGDDSNYYCRAIDLENDGKTTARYLGHGGEVNQISSSRGDPNMFVTAGADGYARLYDVRHPLPVLTIQSGMSQDNCAAAVVCHPDGIPYIFVSEEEEEAVAMWDVRARAVVYDLATGNNAVASLAWNDERCELYAATQCNYVDRNGYHMGYKPARIPKAASAAAAAGDDNDDSDDTPQVVVVNEGEDGDWEDEDEDEDGGDDEDEDEMEDTDQCWPDKAFHGETYFGHIFDSGDHRIYRYSFKTTPDPSVLPGDGGVSAHEEDSYW